MINCISVRITLRNFDAQYEADGGWSKANRLKVERSRDQKRHGERSRTTNHVPRTL